MRFLFFLLLVLSFKTVSSQDTLLRYSENLKALKFFITNGNERPLYTNQFTVQKKDILISGGVSLEGTVISASKMGIPKYGSPKTPDSYQIRIDSNGFYIDYALLRNYGFVSSRKTELILLKESALLFYPKNPQIGQVIPSGIVIRTQINTEESGFGDPSKKTFFRTGDKDNLYIETGSFIKVEDRKVIDKEIITIMNKKVEAYVIQHNVSSALSRNGNFKYEGFVKEWYTPENGLLAFGIYNQKSKLKLYGVLIYIE